MNTQILKFLHRNSGFSGQQDTKSDPAQDGYGNEEQSPEPKKKYPRSVPFIIVNEFCERFSYFGMRAILVIFFTQIIGYNEDVSTEYFHLFSMAAYFTPIFGAIIADAYLGKYITIFSLSLVYAIGCIVLSYSAVAEKSWIMWIGLISIAVAFGGDQFGPGQEKQLAKFFSFFYMAINAGGLLSTFVTPIMHEDVHCFGRDSCFPLAFGVPAVLMIVSLTSLGRKFFKKGQKRDHWLDYADDKYDAQTITDFKAASRWTLQATKMDGKLGSIQIKPDQIQIVNPIMI
ncbi:unnamed protein product, partial [Medioppia subpectinata]